MSATINWLVGGSWAVHIPFHRPVKTIFHHLKGGENGRLERGMRPSFHGDKKISYRIANLASLEASDTLYLYLTVLKASVSTTLFIEDENR